MEYRNRVNLNQEDWGTARHDWYVDGKLTYLNDVPYDKTLRFSAMNDVVTPNFQSRSARGEVINSPMYQEYISFTQGPVFMYHECWDSVKPYYSHGQEPLGFVNRPEGYLNNVTYGWESLMIDWITSRAGSLIDLADAKASANVGKEELLLLASLGELPETVRWATSLLTRFIKVARFFSSGGKNKGKEVLRYLKSPEKLVGDASNFWLEFRYAVRPLVYEMYALQKALNSKILADTRYTARGTASEISFNSDTVELSLSPYVKANVTTQTRLEASSRSGILYAIDANFSRTAAIWGFDKPLSSVYELIPFSFILDWFFSVGDVIAALDVNSSYRRLAGWNVTTVTEQICVTVSEPHVYYEGVYDTVTCRLSGLVLRDQLIMRKMRRPSMPTMIQPRLKINLSTAKLIDLLTIARNLIGHGK